MEKREARMEEGERFPNRWDLSDCQEKGRQFEKALSPATVRAIKAANAFDMELFLTFFKEEK